MQNAQHDEQTFRVWLFRASFHILIEKIDSAATHRRHPASQERLCKKLSSPLTNLACSMPSQGICPFPKPHVLHPHLSSSICCQAQRSAARALRLSAEITLFHQCEQSKLRIALLFFKSFSPRGLPSVICSRHLSVTVLNSRWVRILHLR